VAIKVLKPPTLFWECATCHTQETSGPRVTPPMHPCPTLGGFSVPLTPVANNHGLQAGTVRHVLVVREDAVRQERGLRFHGGAPIMAVRTERADGSNDCAVFAPTAAAKLREVA